MVHALITEHRGCLVFELVARRSDTQTHLSTSIDEPGLRWQRVVAPGAHLGISREAWVLLGRVPPAEAGTEPAFAWRRELGQAEHFTWLGGAVRCALPAELRRPVDFVVGGFTLVPNRPSDAARNSVDIKLECRARA